MYPTRRYFLRIATGGAAGFAAGCLDGGRTSQTPTAVGPDTLAAPVLGDESSSVVIRVWEDFSCPHCRTYNESILPKLTGQYLSSGMARYEHHDFPIPISDWSWPIAIAARSVQATRGDSSFWTFTESVYDNQEALGWSTIRDAARKAGADTQTVVSHTRDERWRPVVEADRQEGIERGVDGTPAVYVNDERIATGSSWDTFYQNIASAIDERRST